MKPIADKQILGLGYCNCSFLTANVCAMISSLSEATNTVALANYLSVMS